jgi:NodT family efflux transporter outer membrane factor (OMF) lipoprotein
MPGPRSRFPRPPVQTTRRLAGWLLATVLLTSAGILTSTGCTSSVDYVRNGFKVGPNYCRPAAPTAEQWIEADNPLVDNTSTLDPCWWQSFHDPVLDSLIDTAYQQNLTLRVAAMRVLESRALRGIAAGELFPQSQEAFGSYTRHASSANSARGAFGKRFYDDWQAGAGLAWELDFWGRYRRAVESADASLDASIENYDDALVLLLSEVARRYVELRTTEHRLAYAAQNLEIQRRSLNLAQRKFSAGATTRLDVTQAETNVAQTEAFIPPLETTRRQATNQLCILLGMPPYNLDGILGGTQGVIPSAAAEVAVGIPADLLRRRPDVRRAEREVAAQSARIGIATSDLYPSFFISGNIYVNADNLSNLFDPRSLAGVVGPSFQWNILNYGRLANNIRVQDARFQQLVFEYQDTVLQANAEAEDALIAFLNFQRQVQSLAISVNAASQSVGLVQQQYEEGKTDFNRVLVVQQTLTTQQDRLAVAQGGVSEALIRLYRALGGGWQIRLAGAASPAGVSASPAGQPALALPFEPPLPPAPQGAKS